MLHGDIDFLTNLADVKWLISESGLNKSLIVFDRQYHFTHYTFQTGVPEAMKYIDRDVIPIIVEKR